MTADKQDDKELRKIDKKIAKALSAPYPDMVEYAHLLERRKAITEQPEWKSKVFVSEDDIKIKRHIDGLHREIRTLERDNTELRHKLSLAERSEAPQPPPKQHSTVEEILDTFADDLNELAYEVRYKNDDLRLLPGDVKIARERIFKTATHQIQQLITKAQIQEHTKMRLLDKAPLTVDGLRYSDRRLTELKTTLNTTKEREDNE